MKEKPITVYSINIQHIKPVHNAFDFSEFLKEELTIDYIKITADIGKKFTKNVYEVAASVSIF